MKLPFEILDTDRRQARVTMQAPLAACYIPEQLHGAPARGIRSAQLFASGTDPDLPLRSEIVPDDADYIYPLFRALSQTVIEGYWIDYSQPGVLEESTPLLAGQTVYADHHYWNVERWLGVVKESSWDAEGAHSDGIPGINVELKIDALMNPRIARGLLMRPPAIHSASVTVVFEFDFSHPDLIDEGRFWDLLGEVVAGETVRLIATKILGYWELSLVFQGADPGAKQLPHRRSRKAEPEFAPGANSYAFGRSNELEPHRGLPAGVSGDLATLSAEVAAGRRLLEAARAECRRLAALATLGSDAGELPAALRSIIDTAGADQLIELTSMYRDLTALRFTPSRSSMESAGIADRFESDRVSDTTLL